MPAVLALRSSSIATSVLAVALAAASCNRSAPGRALNPAATPAPGAAAPAPAPAPAGQPGEKTYGAPLAAQAPLPIDDLLAKPDGWKSKTVTVEGQVRKACTRKGCWMELGGKQPGTPGCRVTFKDYGFFVPLDSAGSQARVQGTVEVDTLSASAVRHYEEEGAVFPGKRPDGTAPEVRIVASGVVLSRPGPQ